MTDPAVSVAFRYSEIDYVRGLRAHYASRLRIWLDVSVVIAGAAFGCYLWQSPRLRWLGVTLFILCGVFALLFAAAFTIVPPIIFRREPKFREEYRLTFTQQGIEFTTARIESQLQWSLYTEALVDSYSYVLYHGSRSFTVIPKRVFQSAEQQSAFEKMLGEHMPKIVRKK